MSFSVNTVVLLIKESYFYFNCVLVNVDEIKNCILTISNTINIAKIPEFDYIIGHIISKFARLCTIKFEN